MTRVVVLTVAFWLVTGLAYYDARILAQTGIVSETLAFDAKVFSTVFAAFLLAFALLMLLFVVVDEIRNGP